MRLPALGNSCAPHVCERAFSQREVAEGIQSTTAYISRIERGLANPPLLAMVRLAEAVGRRCRFEIG